MNDRRGIIGLAEQVLNPAPTKRHAAHWWLYSAKELATAHQQLISDLRWLGESRAAYGSEESMREANAALILADILEGKNDAKGWLPSWKWDEWAERNDHPKHEEVTK